MIKKISKIILPTMLFCIFFISHPFVASASGNIKLHVRDMAGTPMAMPFDLDYWNNDSLDFYGWTTADADIDVPAGSYRPFNPTKAGYTGPLYVPGWPGDYGEADYVEVKDGWSINFYVYYALNGGWSAYSPASCPTACGNPASTLTRTCTNPTPQPRGAGCSGSATISCAATAACVCSAPLTRTVTVSCDANASGYAAISGAVTRSQTKGAYPGCAFPTPVTSANSTYVSDNCVYPTPVPGGWSAWSPATCPTDCGTAASTRTRTCTNPTPAYGGADCSLLDGGNATSACAATAACGCSAPLTQNVTVACDANVYGYAAISGVVTRSQIKSAYPGCAFPTPVTTANSTYVSDTCVYPPPVPGGWSAWSPLSCPTDCGLPASNRTRTCDNPAPSNGGADCSSLDGGNATSACAATAACSCPIPTSASQSIQCSTRDSGWTGTITQTRTKGPAPACSWGSWVDTINDCSCATPTETQTLTCNPGYSGSITQTRTKGAYPGCTWGSWITTSDTCTLAVVPPTTPTGFSASPSTCGNYWMNLSWNATAGATNYKVYRNGTLVYNDAGIAFSDLGLAPGSTHPYSITASNSAGVSGTAITSGTVASSCVGSSNPDLIVSDVTPTDVTVGVSTTFRSVVTNDGASTGAGFNNFFQVSTGSGGTGTVTDLPSFSMLALASGSSRDASVNYTFPSVGTYYMRACADKSSSASTGTISEANENNNCSNSWVSVLVSNVVTPVTGACGTRSTLSPYSAGTTGYPGGSTYCSSPAPEIPSNPAFPSPGSPVTWTCPGSGTGLSSDCSASVLSLNSITVEPMIGGRVESEDTLINCGGICYHGYAAGANVVLKAIPSSSYWQFKEWENACSAFTTDTCNLIIIGSKTVKAKFAPREFKYIEF